MTHAEHAKELREAARRLGDAVDSIRAAALVLNANSVPCRECGLRRYESFVEFKGQEALLGAAEKIERLAADLEAAAA